MLNPDISLLRDHGVSGNRFYNLKKRLKIPYNNPFCIKFTEKNKNLYYIAAIHSNDINSKTFKLIKNIITKADIVIIEGVTYERGLSPDVSGRSFSEVQYAGILATKNKIPFSGVEPSDKFLYKQLIKNRIKKKDIILYEILREYKVFCRNGNTEKEFNEHINTTVIPYLQKYLHFKKFDFHTYFEHIIREKFNYCQTNLEIASPNKNGKYITNKIGAKFSYIRDEAVIKNLYTYLNQYNDVVIIYGQNHYYSHLKILEKTFGKPVRSF
jgi:hypothetical protein